MKSFLHLLLLTFIAICFVFGTSLVAAIVVPTLFGIPATEFLQQMQSTSNPDYRTPVLLVQGLSQLGGFLASALFFYFVIYRHSLINSNVVQQTENNVLRLQKTPLIIFAAVFLLAVVLFPVVWILGALNNAIDLPASMDGLEAWMRTQEELMSKLTLFMTDFDSPMQTLLGFLVIAVIAGIAEEVFFRGTVQPLFQTIFKNHHTAIWVTAFIFSAIHMQFYGFLPRMLLGAIFGYLYFYTCNIVVPIWGHILNNGLTLMIVLLVGNQELLDTPKMENEQFMMMSVFAAMSALIGMGILVFIQRKISTTG